MSEKPDYSNIDRDHLEAKLWNCHETYSQLKESYDQLEAENAALLEALELAERHIRSEMHSAHVPMQGKDLASIQEAIREASK